MLSKEASSTSFWVFGMTWPGIELQSPGPLANTQTIMSKKKVNFFPKLKFAVFLIIELNLLHGVLRHSHHLFYDLLLLAASLKCIQGLPLAGQSILVCPGVGVYKRTSLRSLSLLLQQCPACLTWMVREMGGSCCWVGLLPELVQSNS